MDRNRLDSYRVKEFWADCSEFDSPTNLDLLADRPTFPCVSNSIAALVTHHDPHGGVALTQLATEIARILENTGVFGIDIYSNKNSSPLRAVLDGRLGLPSWHALCELFFNSGLWIDDRLLLMGIPAASRSISIRPGVALPLADRVALRGSRIDHKVATMNNEILRSFEKSGEAESVCGGMSMSPTFAVGDRLVFAPCNQPKRGDIVLILGKTSFLAHRVVATFYKKNIGWIIHRGDATDARPGFAPKWRVIGKLVNIKE